MATPFSDMEAALWSLLASKSAYTALGLTEYKGHLGEFIPYDLTQITAIPSSAFPIIGTGEPEIEQQDFSQSGVIRASSFDLFMAYAAAEGAESRATSEAAANVITTILDDAKNTNLGDAAAVWQSSYEGPTVQALRNEGQDKALFWVWTWRVQIQGNRTQYTI